MVAGGDGDLTTARMDDERMGGRGRSEWEGGRTEERKGSAWFARKEVSVGDGRSYLKILWRLEADPECGGETESEILLLGARLALARCLLDSRGEELLQEIPRF